MNPNTWRPAPLDVRLHLYWRNLPHGHGVTLDEMVSAMDAADGQAIRASLTRLRKGRVPDPSGTTKYLPPLPVRWNSRDRKYYDLSRVTGDIVAQQIPAGVMSGAVAQLLTRVATLHGSIGGLEESAQHLLSDDETKQLLLQIPFEEIWRVQDYLLEIGRARQLLELQRGSQTPALPQPHS